MRAFVSMLIGMLAFAVVKAEGVGLAVPGMDRPQIGSVLTAELTGADLGEMRCSWWRGNYAEAYETDPVGEDLQYELTAADLEHWIKVSVKTNDVLVAEKKFWFSKLPVVYFETADGSEITSKTAYKDGHLRIQGNDEFPLQYDGEMEIKGRGNSSWNFSQKPYKLKLGSKTNLFGFGKNKHWVLISNYQDRSLMRNKFGSDLAKTLGIDGMDMTWVVGIKNGAYNGVYMLSEHIRIDGNRVDIFDWESKAEDVADALYKAVGASESWSTDDQDALEAQMSENFSWISSGSVTYRGKTYSLADYGLNENWNLSGGYLLEIDGRYDETSKFKSTRKDLPVNVNSPEFAKTDTGMMNAIKNLFNQLEVAYCSVDGYSAGESPRHYSELADMSSMVAYWLTMDTLGNVDANGYSRYCSKDVDAPFRYGPAWDFDVGGASSTASSWGDRSKSTQWAMGCYSFYCQWTDDPFFCLRGQEMYWGKVRPWLEDVLADEGVIAQNVTLLTEAAAAHDLKFHVGRSFASDVGYYKTYLKERKNWFDAQFANLDDLVLSLKTASDAPYEKASDQICIEVINGTETNGVCKEDFVIGADTEVKVRVGLELETAACLDAYVDGIKVGRYSIAEGQCEIEIAPELLLSKPGERDIVQLIVRDSTEGIVGRSYATLFVETPDVPPPLPDNVFLPSGNGESWDCDDNWARGYFPNAPGEIAFIGEPTATKKNKTYRNIHIENHSVTVGVIEVTNGGWTNRIDNDVGGNLVFDGGQGNARLAVTDLNTPGLLKIDLDDLIVLDSDLTCVVSNHEGSADYGGLWIGGRIAGNGYNLKKSGPGRMTLEATAAEGMAVISKLQIEEGTVALAKPIHVGSITKEGTLWLQLGGTDLSTALSDAVICDEKISVNHVFLFASTFEGGKTFYGGAIANTVIGKSTVVSVYVPSESGTIVWNGTKWKECEEAVATAYEYEVGRQTYKVDIPAFVESGDLNPSAGVLQVEVLAETPEQAIAQIAFVPPVDDGHPVVSPTEYASYFKVTAAAGEEPGCYVVSAELDEENLKPELDQALQEAFSDATVFSSLSSSVKTAVTVETLPGLYYSFQSTDSLNKPFVEGERKLATGISLTLDVPALGDCGFHRLNVSIAPTPKD